MESNADYLTTKELAELLRIKERKIYDLAASGDVPCVRVVGKLLFPRAEVTAWIAASHSGPSGTAHPIPNVFAGSHDPLLDWALRESGSGLAAFFDGSHDGLTRLLDRQAIACSLHIHQKDGWNTDAVSAAASEQPVVLIELARRLRGLIVAKGNPLQINSVADIKSHRFARRQTSAASQGLFEELAREAGYDPDELPGPPTPARTEDDVARVVAEGKADAAFGLSSLAQQFNLDFVSVTEERFDLLVWRQAWFDPAFQAFLDFTASAQFKIRAAEMGGYDLNHLGRVHYNAP
jgi:excisionase family DNA binding protein